MVKFSIYSIQVSFFLLETTSNIIKPEYSVKVLNTENVILSLGDVDDDTNYDLEVIKNHPENSLLDKKLYAFHKYINLAEKTESPQERKFKPNSRPHYFMSSPQINYPDSPYEIAADERQLSMLERRKGRVKKLGRKRRRKKKKQRKKRTGKEPSGEDIVTTFVDVEDVEAEEDYMEKEYLDYLEKSQKNHAAYKYSDEGKPEETLRDVLFKIMDLKTPRNCTNMTGIGVQAIECIVKNFEDGVFGIQQVIHGLFIILLIWICIYLAIALPLWCVKGWCFCCCRCAFCFPKRTVDKIQKYIRQNPPGVIRNPKGETEHYNPSIRESELYERIKRSIAEF